MEVQIIGETSSHCFISHVNGQWFFGWLNKSFLRNNAPLSQTGSLIQLLSSPEKVKALNEVLILVRENQNFRTYIKNSLNNAQPLNQFDEAVLFCVEYLESLENRNGRI